MPSACLHLSGDIFPDSDNDVHFLRTGKSVGGFPSASIHRGKFIRSLHGDFGKHTQGSNVDSQAQAGYVFACKYKPIDVTGITRTRLLVTGYCSTSAMITMGVYSDENGRPKDLLKSSNIVVVFNGVLTWANFLLSTPLAVDPTKDYWFVWAVNEDMWAMDIYYDVGSANQCCYGGEGDLPFGMPTVFPFAEYLGDFAVSVYGHEGGVTDADDKLWISLKKADDTYYWKQIV